ncbi:MAG: hypothetical protein GC180_01960 [Bacteroidetes bacterium]|nr:hypothetical protein [Bacteroidota bacterium]
MKRYISLPLILVVMLISFFACKKENCHHFETAYVSAVSAPEYGKVLDSIPVRVALNVENGCGQFGRFDVNVDRYDYIIGVEAEYVCGTCVQKKQVVPACYYFIPSTSGTYHLKFKSEDDEFITRVIYISY